MMIAVEEVKILWREKEEVKENGPVPSTIESPPCGCSLLTQVLLASAASHPLAEGL